MLVLIAGLLLPGCKKDDSDITKGTFTVDGRSYEVNVGSIITTPHPYYSFSTHLIFESSDGKRRVEIYVYYENDELQSMDYYPEGFSINADARGNLDATFALTDERNAFQFQSAHIPVIFTKNAKGVYTIKFDYPYNFSFEWKGKLRFLDPEMPWQF